MGSTNYKSLECGCDQSVLDNYCLLLLYSCIICYQVGIDLVGPLPKTKSGNRYIVTLVDYFSKWPEAEALPDKTAEGVALFLYRMICR